MDTPYFMLNKMTFRILLIILINFVLSACTTIPPLNNSVITKHPERFSHQDFDEVLSQHVNQDGKVDYSRLQKQPEQFERYYQQIANFSPDSHPASFRNESDQLAYWINAYNAAVIKTVLSYYPINSIEDVKPPLALFFLPDKTGFFLFQKPTFGKISTSLYYLENSVIRERFLDPRVHFALNCASLGCPKLPSYAFIGDKLNQQLDFETKKFFSEKRNFMINHKQKTIFLSSILKWYEEDFTNWYEQRYPEQEGSLIKYIALYVDEDQADFLFNQSQDYSLEFVPYDWGLNDQKEVPEHK